MKMSASFSPWDVRPWAWILQLLDITVLSGRQSS